jgi:Tfp pilus assembly protein PilV
MPTRGFTVVEVIVAMLVLLTGIVALVGSSSLVTRQLGRARIIGSAAQVAVQRLETLRRAASQHASAGGAACQHPSFASGSSSTRGLSEVWTVDGSGGVRAASVVVTYARIGGTSRLTLHTLFACY